MKYFAKLPGKRLYLSPMNADDLMLYTKWMNDLEVTDRLGMSAQVTSTESEEKWLLDNNSNYQFAIVRKEEDRLIGNCGFQDFSPIHQAAEVGLFIGEEQDRSKGYGSEVLTLLLDYGFHHLNLHNIMLKVFSFNERAIHCYEKVGFREFGRRSECYYVNGQFHDQIMMQILKDEWCSKTK